MLRRDDRSVATGSLVRRAAARPGTRARGARPAAGRRARRARRRVGGARRSGRRQDRAARVRGRGWRASFGSPGRPGSRRRWSSRSRRFSSCVLRSSSFTERLPQPQHDALGVAFGLIDGPTQRPRRIRSWSDWRSSVCWPRPPRSGHSCVSSMTRSGSIVRRRGRWPSWPAVSWRRRSRSCSRHGSWATRSPVCRSSTSSPWAVVMRGRCWSRSCRLGWMSACWSGSSPRRAGIRSRCWSCRAG